MRQSASPNASTVVLGTNPPPWNNLNITMPDNEYIEAEGRKDKMCNIDLEQLQFDRNQMLYDILAGRSVRHKDNLLRD